MIVYRSILAGVCVSIGGMAFVGASVKGSPLLGSALFSFGLLTISFFSLSLFTGIVGKVFSEKNYINVCACLVFNMATVFSCGVLVGVAFPEYVDFATDFFNRRLLSSGLQVFIKSVFCGIVIYISVGLYNKGFILGIIIGVLTFILSGFEHCIANSFLLGIKACSSVMVQYDDFKIIIIPIIGNSVGSILFNFLEEKCQ
ncbi:MAG: formate/nitrite transporter family protein [Bacteroidales bacterium]